MATVGEQLLQPEDGWRRVNDACNGFTYTGAWTIAYPAQGCSGGTQSWTSTINDTISFSFYGTKIRYIYYKYPTRSSSISVTIDNTDYGNFNLCGKEQLSTLGFEITGLDLGIHNVIITNNTSAFMAIEGIDIDKEGYVICPDRSIGDILPYVDDKWKRIDDTNELIKYTGTWATYKGGYNGTFKYCNNTSNICSFKFNGTKIRIVNATNINWSKDITITIDGVAESYSSYGTTTGNLYNVLVYEKLGLTDEEHTITIQNNEDDKYFAIDAIDIDSTGSLVQLPFGVGDILTSPEDETWQRIDDTDSKIKYVGTDWRNYNSLLEGHNLYNDTRHASKIEGDYCTIKFYSSRIRVYTLVAVDNTDIESHDIYLDGKKVLTYSSYYEKIIGQYLTYENLNMDKKEHTLTIKNNTTNSTSWIMLDCVDIDSDGYLIDFAENGETLPTPLENYTRIDINSENLVDGIVLSKTNSTSDWQTETNNNHYDNTNCYSNINGAKATIYFHGTDLMLIGAYNSSLNSNNISISLDEGTSTTVSESKDISYKTLIYQLHDLEDIDHVLTITNNSNSILSLDAVDINKDGYLYKPTTSNYILIKQNDNYYSFNSSNYDTASKMYKPVSLTDNTENFSDDISVLFTTITLGGETFKPIDKFKGSTFKIISNYNIGTKYKLYGRKTNSSILVSKNNFSTASVDNIKYFNLEGKSTIKIIVSPSDNGWYTYNGGSWVNLGLTIPNKNYSDLTTEELVQWNNAKNVILSQGINYLDLKKCNFSTLSNDSKTLKFAYVIYNENYGGNAIIKNLSWCYSKNGKFKMCKDSEYDIELTNEGALVTSLINTDIMKIISFYEKKVGE